MRTHQHEIAYAQGLIPALKRRALLLEQQAVELESAKSNSKFAVRLRNEAQALQEQADELKAAIDAAVFGF